MNLKILLQPYIGVFYVTSLLLPVALPHSVAHCRFTVEYISYRTSSRTAGTINCQSESSHPPRTKKESIIPRKKKESIISKRRVPVNSKNVFFPLTAVPHESQVLLEFSGLFVLDPLSRPEGAHHQNLVSARHPSRPSPRAAHDPRLPPKPSPHTNKCNPNPRRSTPTRTTCSAPSDAVGRRRGSYCDGGSGDVTGATFAGEHTA